jgi:hypothetical protein
MTTLGATAILAIAGGVFSVAAPASAAAFCQSRIDARNNSGDGRCTPSGNVQYRGVAGCEEENGDFYYSYGPWLKNGNWSIARCAENTFVFTAYVRTK